MSFNRSFKNQSTKYLGSQPYLERLKLAEDLPKGEFEQHLKKIIPTLLPHDKDEFIKLTKNAIDMMGNAATPKLAEAIHSLAEGVANEPEKEFPEEEPVPYREVKEKNPNIFRA